MMYIIYILAFLGVGFLIFLVWFFKIVTAAKKEIRLKPRTFKDAVELMGFIRSVFECKIKHRVVMYGFVESSNYDDSLVKSGVSTDPVLSVDVHLVTAKGHELVNTTCGNINANLKKGDFIAVLPFYNDKQNFWYYVTIAKLHTIYLGKQGFSVAEEYTN